MNIFPIDINPRLCAKLSCDQHVIKILTEATEIYCSAVYHVKKELWNTIPKEEKYKVISSPWVGWAKSDRNRYWLAYYIYHLQHEYKYRFGKEHKAYKVFKHVANVVKEMPYKDIKLSYPEDFLQIVDPTSKCENSIQAYRNYYKYKKKNFGVPMRWTKREVPLFLNKD